MILLLLIIIIFILLKPIMEDKTQRDRDNINYFFTSIVKGVKKLIGGNKN